MLLHGVPIILSTGPAWHEQGQGVLRNLLVGLSALFLLLTSQCVLTHSNVMACLAVLMLAAMQL